jgi:pilus assembly protein CpaB
VNRSKFGIVLVAVAAWMVKYYIDRQVAQERARIHARYEPVSVIVARRELQPGAALSGSTVAKREVPRAFVSKRAIRAGQWQSVAGRALAVGVSAGDPVLKSHLANRAGKSFAQLVGDNERAVTISVDSESAMSGMLRPNDRVDLLTTISGRESEYTFPLAEDVKVIATGGKTRLQRAVGKPGPNGGSQRGGGFNNITVALAPRLAANVTHAQRIGDVRVIMRPEDENSDLAGLKINRNTLLGSRVPDDTGVSVEMITGQVQ